MRTRLASFSFLLACASWSADLAINFYDLGDLGKCLKTIKKNDNEDLDLACPLPEFVAKVREKNYTEPGKRYLVGRLLVKALYARHQSDLLNGNAVAASSEESQSSSLGEMFPEIPASRSQYLQYFFPENNEGRVPVLPPSKEASFVSQSKSLVDEILFWLSPLREPRRGAPKTADFLKDEAAHLLFWTYGLSLRFDALSQLIQSDEKALFHNRDFESLYLNQISQWIRQFGAHPLRPWYAQKIQAKLPAEGGPLSDNGWNYWIESIRLLDRPLSPEIKDRVLGQLRWMWIVSPGGKRNTEVRNLGTELGFSKEIEAWSLSELTWQEYQWRVQALIQSLSTRSADQMMAKLLKDDSKLLTDKDDVWEALQLNIKILKILDERTRIAKLIQKYDEKFKFFEPPAEKTDWARHYERLYQLAVQFWTLEENNETMKIFAKIDAVKDKSIAGVQSKVAYVKARMNEEKDLEGLKKAYKLDLREDQKLELGWRTFFRLFEGNPKQITESLAFIEANAAAFKRMGEFGLKIEFWKAQALSKLKKDKDALKILNSNFLEDPYSFYGLMSALVVRELTGKLPATWEIKNKKSSAEFKEKTYLTSDGYPADEKTGLVARALVLAKARDYDRALAVLKDVAAGKTWRNIAAVDEKDERLRDTSRLFVALGDKRSAMNLMTGLLSRKNDDLSSEDWEFIFPRVFEKEIRKRADAVSLDPWVVSSIIRQESAFNPRARSAVDALGLMQLLPVTAQKEAKILGKKSFKTEDLYDPAIAIELGTNNINRLLKIFDKSYICAFAAYNAGVPPIRIWLNQQASALPLTFIERITYKETRDYVKKLLRNYLMYKRLYEKELPPLPALLTMPTGEVSARVLPEYEDPNWVAQK